ncbi:hypothetical protein LNQ03_07860 [Klebsiella pneumoniae subsp. pneumoniae]|nr:hypothetical protein [Klebsiella pneumoniae subsp. pneumoniae]
MLDVRAYGPETHNRKDAHVFSTYWHVPEMGLPRRRCLVKILSAVNPEDVRPITDYGGDYVRSAVIVGYQVVTHSIYVPYGVDTATVLEKMQHQT